MKVLTTDEMGAADRRSVAAGVSIASLMERAGGAVADFCARHFAHDGTGDGLVVVICGKGNNGGDGFVAARRLLEQGRKVRVVLLGDAGDVRGAGAAALAAYRADTRGTFVAVTRDDDVTMGLAGASLLVDAVVGTGFVAPLRGIVARVREVVAGMATPVVAVDLPSGWDADSMAMPNADAFRADAVVTFTAPKLAHVFGQLTAGRAQGAIVVADIGTPLGAIESATGLTWTGAAKTLAEAPRRLDANKGTFGHVLVVGGSWGKSGAPAMASVAAMRAGAGLVTAAVPERVLPMVAAVTPELMCTALVEEGASLAALEPAGVAALLQGIDVVAVGMGMGGAGATPEFVRSLVARCALPMVVDADALNAFAGRTELLREAARDGRVLVLTPHPGEMARLLGTTVKGVEADRVGTARAFATTHGVTLVLKGWRTLVAHPDGRVAVNTTGNPAMAKGGSGDVLTGIVAAMLAQYAADVATAVEAAVYLHGLAGDFAARAQDEHTVLATDTVAHLWQAFRSRVRDADGLTWIAGAATNGTV